MPRDAGAPTPPTQVTGQGRLDNSCPSSQDLLGEFVFRFREMPNHTDNYPLIHTILDTAIPNWDKVKRPSNRFTCNQNEYEDIMEQYQSLFSKISWRLISIVEAKDIDPKNIVIDSSFISSNFFQHAKLDPKTMLPTEIVYWINKERQAIINQEKENRLWDAFVRMGVLGAFGSLLFLIREYVASTGVKIRECVFRPILGIMLAMAVLVVDIMTHTVISTSGILEMRLEPLYILGLGAGLASEVAYSWVQERTRTAWSKAEESGKADGAALGKAEEKS
ncbi:MAG: hypothetical protein IT555_00690 [Acetobacteraceae bacterium]|nr:hypothetical protein [Acetobacteraceae bacterium]